MWFGLGCVLWSALNLYLVKRVFETATSPALEVLKRMCRSLYRYPDPEAAEVAKRTLEEIRPMTASMEIEVAQMPWILNEQMIYISIANTQFHPICIDSWHQQNAVKSLAQALILANHQMVLCSAVRLFGENLQWYHLGSGWSKPQNWQVSCCFSWFYHLLHRAHVGCFMRCRWSTKWSMSSFSPPWSLALSMSGWSFMDFCANWGQDLYLQRHCKQSIVVIYIYIYM